MRRQVARRSSSSPRRGSPTGRGRPRCARCASRPPRAPAAARLAPRGVALALLGDVGVVAERRDHRRLHRSRDDQPGVLAHLEQRARRSRDRRRRSRRGSRRGWNAWTASGRRAGPVGSPPQTPRIEDADRLGVPAELEVALVADDERRRARAPSRRSWQVLGGQHLTGRVRRRVDPEQPYPRRARASSRLSYVTGSAPASSAPDGVGRVGERRQRDRLAGADAEQRRQQRDEFLAADRRQHADAVRRPEPAGRPAGQRPRAAPAVPAVSG